jgi:hypothetical protein
MPNKVLFILKRREDFNAKVHSHVGVSTGLYNSASFVDKMLVQAGVESKMVVVTDNNDIDREVTQYRPTHVIIEALWVVPSKFAILQKLHPSVKWIIRLHSEMPFMAGEGIAMDWLGDYTAFENIIIGVNAPRMMDAVKLYLSTKNGWDDKTASERIIYLPNYYPKDYKSKQLDTSKDTIDIGCFGAVRLLKNHLMQAYGALQFARDIGKKLRFHINVGRIEMQGDPVAHNLVGLFKQLIDTDHELINHQWAPREEFLETCATMDIGVQVSFTETFNIVGADLVSQGVPFVGSMEIPWSSVYWSADPTDFQDIAAKLHQAYANPDRNVAEHQQMLSNYVDATERVWTRYFKEN